MDRSMGDIPIKTELPADLLEDARAITKKGVRGTIIHDALTLLCRIQPYGLALKARQLYRREGLKSHEAGAKLRISGEYVRRLTMFIEKLDLKILVAWQKRDKYRNPSKYKATNDTALAAYAAIANNREQLAEFRRQVKVNQGRGRRRRKSL
jgi:hypothetical protein